MTKIVFLDRDGVIIEEKNLICNIEDVELLPNSAKAIKLLNENDFKVVVVTNQPVVARGLCTEEYVKEINSYMQELLKKEGAVVDRIYYCPHHPTNGDNPEYTKDCECRKPKPGMLLQAKNEFGLSNLSECYMIGDTIGDIKAGENAGCNTILVKTGHGGRDGFNDSIPDYVADDLYDAAKMIVSKDFKTLKLFINAGGKGERLYPLTKDIPKPLVKIGDKTVLEHIIDWGKNYGIYNFVMMNGHMSEKIINYFQDGKKFGVRIFHSNEPYALGSGGPLKLAKKYIDGRLIHISGDHLVDINLDKMIDFHEKNNSQITVLVHKSTHPHDSDILQVDENGKVLKFVSKHDDHTGAGDLTNAGLAILEPEIISLMEEEAFNFENYLYPILLKNKIRFYGYNTDEFMHDMGTVERLKKCEDYLKNKLSQGKIAWRKPLGVL